MISQETKERIANEAVNYYTGPNLQYSAYDKRNRVVMAYIAGAEAEAKRAEGLVEFLINLRKHPRVTNQIEEMITEALNQYNKPINK